MSRFDPNTLAPQLLAVVPEVREAYEQEAKEYRESFARWSEQDFWEMEEIRRGTGLSQGRHDEPGMYLVFENILLPFLFTLVSNPRSHPRLAEIMDWLESLAASDEIEIRSLVAGTICESLITTNARRLEEFIPFMGEQMKKCSRDQYEQFRVSERTKELLAE